MKTTGQSEKVVTDGPSEKGFSLSEKQLNDILVLRGSKSLPLDPRVPKNSFPISFETPGVKIVQRNGCPNDPTAFSEIYIYNFDFEVKP